MNSTLRTFLLLAVLIGIAAPASAVGGELIFGKDAGATDSWTRYTLEAVGPRWVGTTYLTPSTTHYLGNNVTFIDSDLFGGTGNAVDFCTSVDCGSTPYAVQALYLVKGYTANNQMVQFYWDLRDPWHYSNPTGYGNHCGSPDMKINIKANNTFEAILPKLTCGGATPIRSVSGTFELWDYLNAEPPIQNFEAPLYGLYTNTLPVPKQTFTVYPSYQGADGPETFTWRYRYNNSYGTTAWATASSCTASCSFFAATGTNWYDVEVTMNGRVMQTTSQGAYQPETEVKRFFIESGGAFTAHGPRGSSSAALTAPTPNPAVSRVTLPLDGAAGSTVDVAVFDMLGRVVHTVQASPSQRGLSVDVSTLPVGAYGYRLTVDGQPGPTGRFTVAR